jgi:hypothetical protein
MDLSGFAVLPKMTASGFVVRAKGAICRKWLDNFWQLAIFKTKMATPFSLEYQQKVYLFVICHFIL